MSRNRSLLVIVLLLAAGLVAERLGWVDLGLTNSDFLTRSQPVPGATGESPSAINRSGLNVDLPLSPTTVETPPLENSSAVRQDNRQPSPQVPASDGCGGDIGLDHPARPALLQQARQQGLRDGSAFAGTAISLHETGKLPDCYLTKAQASAEGWSPGQSVWVAGRGRSIGGDRFGNREGRLPERYQGRYREADLDYAGERGRNAARLVFVEGSRGQWLQWPTVDHYDSFSPVRP